MDDALGAKPLKRRRVTRACDECRRKKIKCDGRLPCTHCTVYSYNCTFDQPSNRRRNCPVGYVEKLERKCSRYEQLFRRLLPNFDLEQEMDELGTRDGDRREGDDDDSEEALESPDKLDGERRDSPLSMHVQSLKLNRDENGNVDFRGNSSGSVFLQTVYGQLGVGNEGKTPSQDLYAHKSLHDKTVGNQERSRTSSDNSETLKSDLSQEVVDDIQLPDYDVAYQLTRLCFDKACCIIQFVHEPSFYTKLAQCYEDSNDNQPDENFLGVLYSVLAVGCLFLGSIKGGLGIEEPKIRAFQYFQASKSSMDPMDRANTEILQTLICQILFLQSTGNMSTCWTYVGTALRCAQRMGLHKKFEDGFDPVERQLRCKMFWSIRNIEVFLHSILGLPKGIADEDFDQCLPLEIDDEYISTTGITAQPEDKLSTVVSFNAYSRLITIMADIVRLCFPLNNTFERTQRIANQGTIDALDRRLEQWDKALHPMLSVQKSFQQADISTFRQSRLLRYAYFHAYLLLNRPYMHYISSEDDKFAEQRKYGVRARTAAIGVLQLTEEIFINEPTCFGHWFSIYGTFFAGMMVLYCIKVDKSLREKTDRAECLRYLEIAKQAMALCSNCSYAAERCHDMLDDLAKQVPVQQSISNAASKTFNTVHRRGLSTSSNTSTARETTSDQRESGSRETTQRRSKIKRESKDNGNAASTTSKHSNDDSPPTAPASMGMANLNLSSDNFSRSYQNQVGLSKSAQIAMQQGLFPASPSTYGYHPYPVFPQATATNLHTQDTYQPNVVQDNYQDYFAMLEQTGPGMQAGPYAYSTDFPDMGQFKASDAGNQWQDYYGNSADNVQEFMPTGNDSTFMYAAYPPDQYGQ